MALTKVSSKLLTDLATLANNLKTYLNPFGTAMLHIVDQKTAGTQGGGFTAGGWRTRDLNTILTNEISGASLSTNQITLPIGVFYIEASAPAYHVATHQARLYNITNSVTTIPGTSEYSRASEVGSSSRSLITGRFTLVAPTVFEIQHYCITTDGTQGFGVALGQIDERYTNVIIWKLA